MQKAEQGKYLNRRRYWQEGFDSKPDDTNPYTRWWKRLAWSNGRRAAKGKYIAALLAESRLVVEMQA